MSYSSIHSAFRKKMRNIQKREHAQNPYTLKKMVGRFLYEADDNHIDTLPFKRIEGTDLSRVKEDTASYAIGDKDGNPITDFDFVYVSSQIYGDKDRKIEVITKDGESRFFDVDEMTLIECGGAAAGAVAAPSAPSSGIVTGDSISTEITGPHVDKDGGVMPFPGLCNYKIVTSRRAFPRGVDKYVSNKKSKHQRKRKRKI